MKCLFVILLSFIMFGVYARSKYKNIVKISPLKLAGITNAAIELTYERLTGKLFGTQVMASCLLPGSLTDLSNEVKPKTQGFRFSVEEKIYYRKRKRIIPYFALELNYMWNRYRSIGYFGEEDILDSAYIGTNYQDSFAVKKQTISINTKWGFQLIVKNFCFDFFAGVGLRYRMVEHVDRLIPTDAMEGTRHPSIRNITDQRGNYWTVSIPLNIRIGYAF